jgi:hypothetical protein
VRVLSRRELAAHSLLGRGDARSVEVAMRAARAKFASRAGGRVEMPVAGYSLELLNAAVVECDA